MVLVFLCSQAACKWVLRRGIAFVYPQEGGRLSTMTWNTYNPWMIADLDPATNYVNDFEKSYDKFVEWVQQ